MMWQIVLSLVCVAFLGAIQGIAQEKVRVEETPLPEKEWIMDILLKSDRGDKNDK